jgi:hypothetical protein
LTAAVTSTTQKDTDTNEIDGLWKSTADGFNDKGEYGDFTAVNTTEATKAKTNYYRQATK